ncbi:MAG TPA: hypothetical protein DIW61_11895 [Candidatus Aminicenantes bacterium]|nr:hypothetical protein [Candidatus Aminicenantes bacterium]
MCDWVWMTSWPKNRPAEKSRPVPKKARIFFDRGLIQTSFSLVSRSMKKEFGCAVAVPFFPFGSALSSLRY